MLVLKNRFPNQSLKTAAIFVLIAISTLIFATASNAEFHPKFKDGELTDKLDADGELKIEQFVEYAAFMGISEDDISRAMWAGEFSPSPEDVYAVYGELALLTLRNLGATIEPGVEWFNQGNYRELGTIFGTPLKSDNSNYLEISDEKNRRLKAAWIDRFGVIPDGYFSFVEQAGRPISSKARFAESVPLPYVIVKELGDRSSAWFEYVRVRDEVFIPHLVKQMANSGLTIETASIDTSVSGVQVEDFAYPDFIRAVVLDEAGTYAEKPMIPLAYVAGINEALNDQSILFLMDSPRSFIKELDAGLGSAISRALTGSRSAVNESTNMGAQSVLGFFQGMANARREGLSIQDELRASNEALAAPAIRLREAKEFGTRDGRSLALLFEEDVDAFRTVYGGLIKFVREDVR